MNQDVPRITVVTPSYNQADFLEQTICSILSQDYPNLEYIIVDGGSNDGSKEIIQRYRDQITHAIIEPDNGQSDAICKGLSIATGQFFNWINSDDTLQPGTLWELAEKFTDKFDLYTFSVRVEGDLSDPYLMHNQNLSAKGMLRCDRYSFSQPGMWFRLDALHQCGGIDRSLNYGFDWDMVVRYLSEHPRVYYSNSVGAMFRLHPQSKTFVETSKVDQSENAFEQEHDTIRTKLETTLRSDLASASRLGRKRRPWNDYLIATLDDLTRSPIGAASEIFFKSLSDPKTRLSFRTLGSIARLLSRYVRPSIKE